MDKLKFAEPMTLVEAIGAAALSGASYAVEKIINDDSFWTNETDLPLEVEYRGTRVMSLEVLAPMIGYNSTNALQKAIRTSEMFGFMEEGQHYFNATGEELEKLKGLGIVRKRAPSALVVCRVAAAAMFITCENRQAVRRIIGLMREHQVLGQGVQ